MVVIDAWASVDMVVCCIEQTGFTLNAGLGAGATASIFVEEFVKGM